MTENISEIPGCLQSEKCAQRWLKKVNRLYSKVSTAANVYEVIHDFNKKLLIRY